MPTVAGAIFPLDEQLGLHDHRRSPLLACHAVWLSSLLPDEQAEPVLAGIGGYRVAATTLWEPTQQVGEKWLNQQQTGHGSVEGTGWETGDDQPPLRRSVRMDGGLVPVRGEGWKALKVGVIGRRLPPGETVESAVSRRHDLPYTAQLGDAHRFSTRLWQLAVEQPVPSAGPGVVTADGAAWIGRLVAD